MPSRPAFLATLVLTALASAALTTAALSSSPAHADTPRVVVCQPELTAPTDPGIKVKLQAWMNEQTQAGKTDFIQTRFGVCAW